MLPSNISKSESPPPKQVRLFPSRLRQKGAPVHTTHPVWKCSTVLVFTTYFDFSIMLFSAISPFYLYKNASQFCDKSRINLSAFFGVYQRHKVRFYCTFPKKHLFVESCRIKTERKKEKGGGERRRWKRLLVQTTKTFFPPPKSKSYCWHLLFFLCVAKEKKAFTVLFQLCLAQNKAMYYPIFVAKQRQNH